VTKMLEDLAEVVDYLTNYPDTPLNGVLIAGKCYALIKYHHAEIAQNAESAKRLTALEQALEEKADNHEYFRDGAGYGVDRIKDRADELMREWGFDTEPTDRRTPESPE